jgi:hypothetical protein
MTNDKSFFGIILTKIAYVNEHPTSYHLLRTYD